MTFSRHIPRKRFGQHWLIDSNVLDKIFLAANLQPEDRVLEVGPGRGALTERLLNSKVSSVHAIELDRDLVSGLRKRFSHDKRFTLSEGDVLANRLNPYKERPFTKVVANIPYNITGPLLDRLLGRLDKPSESTFQLLILLLQKEVAERICAEPCDSCFSALSVRMQLMSSCESICTVPPSSFDPPPKVHSQVIAIKPFSQEDRLDSLLARRVEILLKRSFLARRKMLRNTLTGLFPFDELDTIAKRVGISLEMRPQELSPASWVALAKGLAHVDVDGNSL